MDLVPETTFKVCECPGVVFFDRDAQRGFADFLPPMPAGIVDWNDTFVQAIEIAYRLGAHHRRTQVDWSTLPFGVVRSPALGLPVPHIAPRIRELEAIHIEAIGSHTFFVTRVVSDTGQTDRPLLHHTGGWHQHLRATRGHAFPAAG